jgi:hypothetical protein
MLLGAVSGGAQEQEANPSPDPEAVALLDYDASAPLDLQEIGVEERDGAIVRDITFASPGRTVLAYLVEPADPTVAPPYAGIVYFHWLEQEAPTSNRTEFLEEAVALAPAGVVSVLLQGVFPWSEAPTDLETDRAAIVEEILAARRAIDLLLARGDVDPGRLAAVGHDYGAMYLSALAAVDRRPIAYDLMAATPRHADWNVPFWLGPAGMTPADQQAYKAGLAPLDPLTSVASAAPAALLFQFGRADFYISSPTGFEFFYAASDPKEILPYDAEHPLDEAAAVDRDRWLRATLGLAPGTPAATPAT